MQNLPLVTVTVNLADQVRVGLSELRVLGLIQATIGSELAVNRVYFDTWQYMVGQNGGEVHQQLRVVPAVERAYFRPASMTALKTIFVQSHPWDRPYGPRTSSTDEDVVGAAHDLASAIHGCLRKALHSGDWPEWQSPTEPVRLGEI